MDSHHRGIAIKIDLIEAMAGQKISFFFLMSIIETVLYRINLKMAYH
jgi:hypothetical protein